MQLKQRVARDSAKIVGVKLDEQDASVMIQEGAVLVAGVLVTNPDAEVCDGEEVASCIVVSDKADPGLTVDDIDALLPQARENVAEHMRQKN